MTEAIDVSIGTFPRGFSEEHPPHWPMVRADSLVELRYGRALTESVRRAGTIPVYGTNGRTGWHDAALSPGPGVILGRKGMGNLGVEWCPSPFWVIDTAYYAQARTAELDLCYFYYLISYIGLNHLKDGTSNPSLSRDTFGAQLLPLPPINEQTAIAATLSEIDDKIEQNRRAGAKLEELARGVFKAWFVDFEPVKAKAAGATTFPGMPPETFAALPSRLVDSELGPVPEGWEVKAIGDVVTVRGGGTPSTKEESFWLDGTHCWATPKDLSSLQHPLLLSTGRRITDAGLAKISSGLLPIDTILLSSRAPVGYLALAKVPTAVNQGFIAIECNKSLKPHFVLHWLDARMEDIKGRASGTTFAEISKSAFRPIPVIIPSPTIIESFEDNAKPMFDLITQLMTESAKLAALRDYLLPRLLSGRVRVRTPASSSAGGY